MSFIAITIYLATGTLNTWLFYRSLQKVRLEQGGKPSYPLQNWPKPLRFLYMLLWTTVAAFREPFPFAVSYQAQHTESNAQLQWSPPYSGCSSQRTMPLNLATTVR
jgi:hypothetical protein